MSAPESRDRTWAGGGPRRGRAPARVQGPVVRGLIASAVHAGHRYARALGAPDPNAPVPVDRAFDVPV